jgi:hypothetical protein
MVSSGMLHRVALVRTDVSEELSASIIRVTRIGELGTTLGNVAVQRGMFPMIMEIMIMTMRPVTHKSSLLAFSISSGTSQMGAQPDDSVCCLDAMQWTGGHAPAGASLSIPLAAGGRAGGRLYHGDHCVYNCVA